MHELAEPEGLAPAHERAAQAASRARVPSLRADATSTTPALVIRPWCEQDVAALVEAHQDPAMRRWLTSTVETEADAAHWVRTEQRGWTEGSRYAFAVLETQPGVPGEHLAGNVVLKHVAPGKPSAEVGYWTSARARGRGVARRALDVLTGWAFDTFGHEGLERLELLHQVDNPASCRVAEKCGYALDRVLPGAPPAFPLDGHLHVRHLAGTSGPATALTGV
ncbi:GNAT family N-acetyltransferase [Streptomyces sp. NPDC006274]|uniref:GNAT family N-acetyltransferase n=1 Tax=unclassified Streptomyces TaxID=2593676 RepID=UPI0033AF66EE